MTNVFSRTLTQKPIFRTCCFLNATILHECDVSVKDTYDAIITWSTSKDIPMWSISALMTIDANARKIKLCRMLNLLICKKIS